MEENSNAKDVNEQDGSDSINLNDAYFEDDAVYSPFEETDNYEIILPIEEDALTENDSPTAEEEPSVAVTKPVRKKKLQLFTAVFSAIINLIFLTGDNTIALFKWIFRKTAPFIAIPFRLAFRGAKKSFLKLRTLILHKPSAVASHIKVLAIEKAAKNKKPSYIKAFFSYIFSEKRLAKTVFNLVFPAVILFVALSVYQNYNSKVFALEVIYNGQSLGYIENESVFEKALTEATDLVYREDYSYTNDTAFTGDPVYKSVLVSFNKLSNPGMISESIIANADINYVRACGIYIDGEFLCAVKNESDALAVFDSLLEPYRAQVESTATVAFVEEISCVPGLYPEDSELIWDSFTLRNLLSKPKSEEVVHTFTEGDTVKSVYTKYGITYNQLAALNPGVDLTKPEEITTLVVARQTNYVRVKVMRTNVRTQEIPFQTVEKNSSSLAKGTKKTSQEGVNGIMEVTELITYIDGVVSYTTTVSQREVKAPVNKIVLIGTNTSSSSSGSSSSGWTWPTRGAYSISSHYGYRSASISGWSFHGGIDIVVGGQSSSGIPVVAAAAGTVEKVQKSNSGYGYMVLINHGNGIKTRYAHMKAGSITVSVGQRVSKGQQIGKIGSTGNSTGPHLHFEVIVNGSKVNPLKYVSR